MDQESQPFHRDGKQKIKQNNDKSKCNLIPGARGPGIGALMTPHPVTGKRSDRDLAPWSIKGWERERERERERSVARGAAGGESSSSSLHAVTRQRRHLQGAKPSPPPPSTPFYLASGRSSLALARNCQIHGSEGPAVALNRPITHCPRRKRARISPIAFDKRLGSVVHDDARSCSIPSARTIVR